jgi:hypothetical protein
MPGLNRSITSSSEEVFMLNAAFILSLIANGIQLITCVIMEIAGKMKTIKSELIRIHS